MPAFSLDPEQTTWCARLRTLAAERLRPLADQGEPGRVNRPLVAALGELGLLARLFDSGALDLCLMRESLAQVCTEAETALALQGLGAHPVAAFGTPDQRRRWLPEVTAGRAVPAFALSEPAAGSDAAALTLRAVPDPGTGGWRLYGEKRWISNAPEADFMTVFARMGEGGGGVGGAGGAGGAGGRDAARMGEGSGLGGAGGVGGRDAARAGGEDRGARVAHGDREAGDPGEAHGAGEAHSAREASGARGASGAREARDPGEAHAAHGVEAHGARDSRRVTAFLVPADRPGLTGEPLDMLAPHAIGGLAFDGVPVGPEDVLGEPGQGFKVAMNTLNLFRPSVGAFAVGMAQAALDATLAHTADRRAFGGVLADLQAVAHQVAEMATRTEAARLLVYAAAEAYDRGDPDVPRRAAMAKLLATETAQYVVDAAVQLHGARALQRGHLLEHLYREVRAPRIYEGATEVQRTIIAKELYRSGKARTDKSYAPRSGAGVPA
ncbi:acyl-CoA dehydrogenase family protein [Streptomyces sp. NPDC094032]|uniref:acyl-CoA dehydrogenase family protein n=1 Tax=Streptomyces sp. NPDC094032 TaxID=3155308 RepID=UPI003325488D